MSTPPVSAAPDRSWITSATSPGSISCGPWPGFVQSQYVAAGVVGVLNPRSMAVLIRVRAVNQFEDRTRDVSEIRIADQRIEIVFNDSNKPCLVRTGPREDSPRS